MTQPAMDATPLSDGMIECYVVNFLACIAAFNEPPAEAYTIQALRAYAEALKRLRPTPSEQPGEDVEALITLVREKDRLWHDQGIECDHDEWLANAILAAGYRRQAPAPENWRPIETAPRDGTRIIYLDKVGGERGAKMKNPWWVGDCIWRDEDEGVSEGWWDDASWVMAEPLYWRPFILPEHEQ